MRRSVWYILFVIVVGVMVTGGSGCSSMGTLPPGQLVAPQPILDNSGEYMCPYRQDGTLTDWSAQVYAKVIGAEAGKRAGFMGLTKAFGGASGLAKKAGEKAGQKLALEAVGGMEGIRNSSDISFNSLDDMAVYMYVNYSERDDYKKAIRSMNDIYPPFKKAYPRALAKASAEQKKK